MVYFSLFSPLFPLVCFFSLFPPDYSHNAEGLLVCPQCWFSLRVDFLNGRCRVHRMFMDPIRTICPIPSTARDSRVRAGGMKAYVVDVRDEARVDLRHG